MFDLEFRDDFRGDAFDPDDWSVYGKGGKYDSSLASVAGGRAHLLAGVVSGVWKPSGVSSKHGQTFGSFRARVRLDPGSSFRGVCLLWPDGGAWPPEVDFFEIGGTDPDRLQNTQTLHYADSAGVHRMIHTDYVVPGSSFTAWHNVRVDWTPGSLVYLCDGTERARVDSEHVPEIPMHLCLQTGLAGTPDLDAEGGGLHVEWAEIWSYVP